MMRKIVVLLLVIFCPWLVQAEETPPVVEIFDCTYNSGQDRDDLDKAVAYWKDQSGDMEGNADYFAALFTPIRATNWSAAMRCTTMPRSDRGKHLRR